MNKKNVAFFALWTVLVFSALSLVIYAQNAPTAQQLAELQTSFSAKITKTEWQFLLRDASPSALESLKDPTKKEAQIRSIKELLAIANQSVKEGLVTGEVFRWLVFIRINQTAVEYDKNVNKTGIPFALITIDQITAFYSDPKNEAEFADFLKFQINIARENGTLAEKAEFSSEELADSRDGFAKIKIYERLYDSQKSNFSAEALQNLALWTKLNQAQFLARLYTKKVLAEKIKVSESEIQAFIAGKPEFDTTAKRAAAQKLLQRVKVGENFAELAKKFSDDPESKAQGGLYSNVKKGTFLPEFEAAALALQPGQVAPNLVETKYGFHIIKLESKNTAAFTVRHILISTMMKETDDPASPELSIIEFVRRKLELQKERALMDEIVKNNPVEIETD